MDIKSELIILVAAVCMFWAPCPAAEESEDIWFEEGPEQHQMWSRAMDRALEQVVRELAQTDREAAEKLEQVLRREHSRIEREFQRALREEIRRRARDRMSQEGERGPRGPRGGPGALGRRGGSG